VHFAIIRGHVEIIMYLIGQGASVTAANIVSKLISGIITSFCLTRACLLCTCSRWLACSGSGSGSALFFVVLMPSTARDDSPAPGIAVFHDHTHIIEALMKAGAAITLHQEDRVGKP
jgi:hypothetical protein